MTRHLPTVLLIAIGGLAAASAEEPPAGQSLGTPPPATPPPAALAAPEVDIAGLPVLGRADAPVTVVEFMDFECSYCQAFAKETFPALKAAYVDTGKVRWVAHDFPLVRHPRARPAATVAACAGEQGKFWEMHDAMLRTALLREEDFAARARELGLDAAALEACRDRADHAERLDRAVAVGRGIGVAGTPTFLVGPTRAGIARGRLLRGPDLAAFEAALAKYLPADAPAAPPAAAPAP
jgi:protein-disulfide isomerase